MPQIDRNHLHVWWANLRDFDSEIPALETLLSPYERAKAAKFRFLQDRRNYIIRHGLLRVLLGGYVGRPPSTLDFTFGAQGKPELRNGFHRGRIHFNLSHSEDLALYGVTRACPVGVDVEYLCPLSNLERITRDIFSESETESLMALPREHRPKYFFSLWTRKEALIKARGEGLASEQSIRAFFPSVLNVSKYTAGAEPAQICSRWHVRSFLPTAGYLAAVAFRNPDLTLTISQFSDLPAAA